MAQYGDLIYYHVRMYIRMCIQMYVRLLLLASIHVTFGIHSKNVKCMRGYVLAKSCAWYIKKRQNFRISMWHHVHTIFIPYPFLNPYHFCRISTQILWALVAHRLGWLVAPTATAATAAPEKQCWNPCWHGVIILFIHTQHMYIHICHHLHAASWNKHVRLICTLFFQKNLCRLPLSQGFCISRMYVISVWYVCMRVIVREEGRGLITWAILPKSYDLNPIDIYIAWRYQCVKSVRETSCAFSPATFLHFATSHQNPELATPAMRHGFWLPLWLCRVTWGLMGTGFTCGSQEATSAPRLNPKRTWNSERPCGTRWGFSMVQIQTRSMGMVNMPAKERPKLSYFQGPVTISRASYLGFYFEFKAMMSCMLNVNQVLVPKYHKGTCTFAGELQQFSSQYFVSSLCRWWSSKNHRCRLLPKNIARDCFTSYLR